MKKGLGLRAVALVALAAIVALVALMATATPVEAADPTTNGGKVNFSSSESTNVVEFKILASSTASGSFTHKTAAADGQSILCSTDADSGCDANDQATGPQVELKVDDDSPAGYIIVQITPIGTGAGNASTDSTVVSRAQVPTRIAVKAASESIAAADGDTVITFGVEDEKGDHIDARDVTIITNNGTLNTAVEVNLDNDDEPQDTTSTVCDGDDQSCTIETGDAGAKVTLSGSDRAGTATVTFISGDLTATLDIVMYGEVASISAEAEQGSIEVGGTTYIVVTALDRGGNPVADAQVNVDADADDGSGGITGPAERTIKVAATNNADKDADGDRAVDEGDLPACGNQEATASDAIGIEVDTNLQTGDPAVDVGAGTNGEGQCVIRVKAPGADTDTTDDDAARGTHTIAIKANDLDEADDKVSVAIQVGGAPTSITSDAPASVDPLSSTTITYTVWDDGNVRVGAVDATLDQIEGSGKVTDGENTDKTVDGQRSFTFRAPNTPGTAVLLVTVPVGDSEITHTIVLQVGEEEPEVVVEPELPALVQLSDGAVATFVAWTGGETTASQVFANVPNLTVVWKYDGTNWHSYQSAADAPAFLQSNFSLAPNDVLYIVTTGPVTVASGH